MDYEKTLETVKQMVEDGQVSQETAELYFPEIKESGDERIRKAIHIYLDWLDGRKDYAPKGEYSIKDMIAWLNKQWSESNDVVKCLINGMKFYYEDNPEATWGTEKFSMKVKDILSWLEKQSEQKPSKKPQRIVSAEVKEAMYDKPAWSEEDENHIIGISQTIFDAIRHNVIGHKTGDMQINWLRSLKERVGCEANCTTTKEWSEEDENMLNLTLGLLSYHRQCRNWLKSLKDRVQPKQEWSEDNEEILNLIIARLHSHPNVEAEEYDKDYHWLTSLKDRHTWKPSKGQLECLDYAIEKAEKDWSPLTNNRIYLTLKTLKEQLEKL